MPMRSARLRLSRTSFGLCAAATGRKSFRRFARHGAKSRLLIDAPHQGTPQAGVGLHNQHALQIRPRARRRGGFDMGEAAHQRMHRGVSPQERIGGPFKGHDEFARKQFARRLPALLDDGAVNPAGRPRGLRPLRQCPAGKNRRCRRGRSARQKIFPVRRGGKTVTAQEQLLLPETRVGLGKTALVFLAVSTRHPSPRPRWFRKWPWLQRRQPALSVVPRENVRRRPRCWIFTDQPSTFMRRPLRV